MQYAKASRLVAGTSNLDAAHVAALVAIAVLLALVGYGVIRANRYQNAQLAARRELILHVPEELRDEQPEPIWLCLLVLAAVVGGAAAGAAVLGGWGAIVGCVVALSPFFLTRRRPDEQCERVIATVQRQAEGAEREEFAKLVAGLELLYGRKAMRPLRKLVEDAK